MGMRKAKAATLRSRWLGRQLRALRDESGMSVEEVAEYLQRNMGTVSRFENGIYPVRRPDMLAMLDLYGVNEPRHRENLLKLSESVWQTGWWDGYTGDVADSFVDFVWLEELAVEHFLFDNTVLPGLLQTESYARAVMLADDPSATEGQLDRWVELRMTRQAMLDRPDPPAVNVVIDEAVLRRQVGGRAVMKEQLRKLLAATDRPAVNVRVLPFSAGEHAAPMGAFILFKMADPYPEVAYAETPRGALYIESPDTATIQERYDRLWEASMNRQDSVEFIASLTEE